MHHTDLVRRVVEETQNLYPLKVIDHLLTIMVETMEKAILEGEEIHLGSIGKITTFKKNSHGRLRFGLFFVRNIKLHKAVRESPKCREVYLGVLRKDPKLLMDFPRCPACFMPNRKSAATVCYKCGASLPPKGISNGQEG